MMSLRNRMLLLKGQALLNALLVLRRCRRVAWIDAFYRHWLQRLLRRSALFDARFYRRNNADLATSGLRPLVHYLLVGDAQGRCPSPCFDPAFYRAQAPGRLARAHALLHYLYIGRYRRLSPSAWFDVEHYLRENKDVARAGLEPLAHYLLEGAAQGRSPSPQFDSAGYLETYPDICVGDEAPLLHYIREGRFEERQTTFAQGDRPSWIAVSDLQHQLLSLPDAQSGQCANPPVDLVIPVYRGRMETLRCLLSVLRAKVETGFELVVINDASPDSLLIETLRGLASAGRLRLIEHAENQGFVCSANQGLCLHSDRDVVLLNADTEVYDGWLDRLRRHALRRPRVGSVTPLSNNASICSYPRPDRDNPYPLELPFDQLDALAAEANPELDVSAPTAVGFCMYLSRACLDEVGLFDEAAFSPGYGEENDFSLRASRLGWTHLIAADVFVRHWGARSFRGQKGRFASAAKAVIRQRYPGYRQAIAAFQTADPLAEARARLDWARLQRRRGKEQVLILHHRRGGGSARRVEQEIDRLQAAGAGVFLARPVLGDPARIEIAGAGMAGLANPPRVAVADQPALIALLQRLGIGQLQTHGLVDLAPQTVAQLERAVRAARLRWVAFLHDYEVICPRINLVDRRGRYCGEPGPMGCASCLLRNGSPFGRPAIQRWRALHERALIAAEQVLVPDVEVAARIRRYFPGLRVDVAAHDAMEPVLRHALSQAVEPQRRAATAAADPDRPAIRGSRVTHQLLRNAPAGAAGGAPRLVPDWVCTSGPAPRPLHVVVLGAIGRLKGFDVLLRCARDARARGLGLRFSLLGYGLDDKRLRAAGVRVTGRYREVDAPALLRGLRADLVWLPSTCPETFCYTLSLALSCGLPVSAFDLGAIGARLRRLGLGAGLVDLSLADRAGALNAVLLEQAQGRAVQTAAVALR